ncbi:MAG: UbiA family prenyltransferase [Chitinophagaceae bacterium]|nr:UbiA family prenyltransferase [Chitinophagaceae bacterium]
MILKKTIRYSVFDFFLYSNLYITGCALLMVEQANHLFSLQYDHAVFFAFVSGATLCSYNFHWYLTPLQASASPRIQWNDRFRNLLLVFFIAGLCISLIYGWQLRQHWLSIAIGVIATFLYSAPKIPLRPFELLAKVAVGKTIFLSFVWMYVTSALPVLLSDTAWTNEHTFYCISRFFLIYAICILFDYRDRETDRQQGVKSIITWVSEKNVKRIFFVSLGIFAVFTLLLVNVLGGLQVFLLLVPGGIVWGLYRYAVKHFGDYLYYFVLDGLMMLSALLMLLLRI